MLNKKQLRKKYFKIRKKKYYEVNNFFFSPLKDLIKKEIKKKPIFLSMYYPSNFEVNILSILKTNEFKKINILLPVILKDHMKFSKWNFLDTLKVNKYGLLEPLKNVNYFVPDIMLIPLLAFDNRHYRLGYGKGYYDKYLNKYLKLNKQMITIGIAFSFQKYHKLPSSNFDKKLDYILTEKGLH